MFHPKVMPIRDAALHIGVTINTLLVSFSQKNTGKKVYGLYADYIYKEGSSSYMRVADFMAEMEYRRDLKLACQEFYYPMLAIFGSEYKMAKFISKLPSENRSAATWDQFIRYDLFGRNLDTGRGCIVPKSEKVERFYEVASNTLLVAARRGHIDLKEWVL